MCNETSVSSVITGLEKLITQETAKINSSSTSASDLASSQNILNSALQTLNTLMTTTSPNTTLPNGQTGTTAAPGTQNGAQNGSQNPANTIAGQVNTIGNQVIAISGQVNSVIQSTQNLISTTNTAIANSSTYAKARAKEIVEIASKQLTDVTFSSIKDTISTKITEVNEKITSNMTSLNSTLSTALQTITGSVSEKLSTGSANLLSKISTALNDNIGKLLDKETVSEGINNIKSALIGVANSLIEGNLSGSALEVVNQVIENTNLTESISEKVGDVVSKLELLGVSEETIQNVKDSFNSIISNTVSKIAEGDLSGAKTALTESASELAEAGILTATNIIEEQQDAIVSTIIEKVGGEESEVGALIKSITDEVSLAEVAEKTLTGDFSGAVDTIKTSLSNSSEKIITAGKDAAESAISGIGNAISNVAEKIESKIGSNILETAGEILTSNKSLLASTLVNKISSLLGIKAKEVTNNILPETKEYIEKTANSLTESINNSALASTAIGNALINIVDSAKTSLNETALEGVNQIISGNVEDGVNTIKMSGLDFANSTIAISFSVISSFLEEVRKTIADKEQEIKEITSDIEEKVITTTDDVIADVKKYAENATETIAENISETYQAGLEALKEETAYFENHECVVETSHPEASIHAAKTVSTGSSASSNSSTSSTTSE